MAGSARRTHHSGRASECAGTHYGRDTFTPGLRKNRRRRACLGAGSELSVARTNSPGKPAARLESHIARIDPNTESEYRTEYVSRSALRRRKNIRVSHQARETGMRIHLFAVFSSLRLRLPLAIGSQ